MILGGYAKIPTFQEFFAAKAAVDKIDDIGLLIKNADDRLWRETIIIAAGVAPSSKPQELIRGLIERGDKDDRHRHQLHLLAVACLEVVTELDPGVEDILNDRLEQLVPPRTIIEATELSSAGELVLPHLLNFMGEDSATVAACVRTAVLVGGERALKVLENYAADSRQEVVSELVRGFDSFNHHEYAQRILARGNHTRLDLSTASIDGIQCLTTILYLDLSRCRRLSDLAPLQALSSLKSLNLSDLDLAGVDLRILSKLDRLQFLYISSVQLGPDDNDEPVKSKYPSQTDHSAFKQADIIFLSSLDNLVELDLSSNHLVGIDFEFIAGLKKLKRLKLSRANLHKAMLSNLELPDTNFEGAFLNSADLVGSEFQYASFNEADLSDTNLEETNLTYASLKGSILTGAILLNTNLQDADLTGADLRGTDLSSAILEGATLTDIQTDQQTSWPNNYLSPHEKRKRDWWGHT